MIAGKDKPLSIANANLVWTHAKGADFRSILEALQCSFMAASLLVQFMATSQSQVVSVGWLAGDWSVRISEFFDHIKTTFANM